MAKNTNGAVAEPKEASQVEIAPAQPARQPSRQSLGTVTLAPAPLREEPPSPEPEYDESAAEARPSLEKILARIRRDRDGKEEPAEKPEAKQEKGPEPQEEPSVAAPSQEGSSLPSWLISRAADYGLNADEAKAWGTEQALSRHLDGLDRVVRHFQKPKEEAKEAKPEPEEDIWGGKKDAFDEEFVGAVERLEAKLAKKYEAKIAALEEDLKFVGGHVQAQVQERNRSAFDKLIDGLDGFEAALGKGSVEAGTPFWENRAKLEAAMNFEQEFYQKLGTKIDKAEAMKSAAAKLFPRNSVPEQAETPKKPVPPKDPTTGKFTPTNRPTARDEPELPNGRKKAAQFVNRYIAEHNLGDDDN